MLLPDQLVERLLDLGLGDGLGHGWLLTSKGRIYEFAEGRNGERVPYRTAEPPLGRDCQEFEGLAVAGDALDVVHLGGGALTLPRYVAATRPGSRQRVVEIDQPLTDLGKFWEAIRRDAHADLRKHAAQMGNGVLAHTHFGQIIQQERDKQPPAVVTASSRQK